VSEIFGPTLQGEGAHAGRRAVFVRIAGCDSHCPWCDTPYAKTTTDCSLLTPEEILAEVKRIRAGCNLVILTGGNPALQDLGLLCALLKRERMEIHVETQGTVVPYWFDRVDLVTICPKIKTSGDVVTAINNIKATREMAPVQLKYVVFTEADYVEAGNLARIWPDVTFVIQPGWDAKTNDYPYGLAKLADRVAKDKFLTERVMFMPQLHRILWGGVRGV